MKIKLDIDYHIQTLLNQEDTNADKKITIDDTGLKAYSLPDGTKVKGTYYLSNLLQELTIAKEKGVDFIQTEKIFELPSKRINRLIKNYYWKGLTRSFNKKHINQIIKDDKRNLEKKYIYVPENDKIAQKHFEQLLTQFPDLFEIQLVPENFDDEYDLSINDKPGILSLKITENNQKTASVPFIVPGGRFNEMYGWDSYFQNIGLLLHGKNKLAKNTLDNFKYQIDHYKKILNANRSYYLTRTQPPFYSSALTDYLKYNPDEDKAWVKSHIETALKDYFTVWMVPGKRLTNIGLNRYLSGGIGITLEAEDGHYNEVLKPYAQKYRLSLLEFYEKYKNREIEVPELDDYFIHDRSVRESGHDTTWRLEGKCADIIPVELNSILYKYETDLSELIKTYFPEGINYQGLIFHHTDFKKFADKRKELVNTYLWNEEKGMYFDYNIKTNKQEHFYSATGFFPLWANLADHHQAETLIQGSLPKFIEKGGIVSCLKSAIEPYIGMPHKQWDYPNGWAPHQMIIWKGLMNYDYDLFAQQLIYRWLWMITKNAVDYNGTIPEKYDVVGASHKVFSEYGNVGTEFDYITKEGFGWMNASYILGLSLLKSCFKHQLDELIDPDLI